MKTKEEFQKQMIDANYKNFDNEDVVLIAYKMYSFIVEQFEAFKDDLQIKYSVSSINQEYLSRIRKEYSIFISRIQYLNNIQLNAFLEELKIKLPYFEEELSYFNVLAIINNYLFTYENWVKTETTLFD